MGGTKPETRRPGNLRVCEVHSAQPLGAEKRVEKEESEGTNRRSLKCWPCLGTGSNENFNNTAGNGKYTSVLVKQFGGFQ